MFERNITLSKTQLYVIHWIHAIVVENGNIDHFYSNNTFKINSADTYCVSTYLWYVRHYVRHLINDVSLLG